MGALGLSIGVSGESDRKTELQDEIFEHMLGFIRARVDDDELYQPLVDPYFSFARDDSSWGVSEGEANFIFPESSASLNWVFPDGGSATMRCMYLWKHWAALALAAEWDAIVEIARKYQMEITSPRRPISAGGDQRFVYLRDNLWYLNGDYLVIEGKGIAIEDLGEGERAAVEAAKETCACPVCESLFPETTLEQKTLAALRDPERALSAATRLASMTTLDSRELMLALIGAPVDPTVLRPLIEKFASRVDQLDCVIHEWPRLDDQTRANGLFAAASAERWSHQDDWYVATVRTAIANDDALSCAATELFGRVAYEPEQQQELINVLDRSSLRAGMRVAAVKGIAAVLRNEEFEKSAALLKCLERETERGGEAGALAREMLAAQRAP